MYVRSYTVQNNSSNLLAIYVNFMYVATVPFKDIFILAPIQLNSVICESIKMCCCLHKLEQFNTLCL